LTVIHRVTGWRCAVCGATRDIADPAPWRCPNSSLADRRHLLTRVEGPPIPPIDDTSSLVAHDRDLAWAAFAASRGLDSGGRRRLFTELDDAVARVGGVHFVTTPLNRSASLSDALAFSAEGGVWVKDETGGVAGSHKARHLLSILLHLRALEDTGGLPERPPLAIASCGNAAIAASTLARAADWPIDVFVPTWMDGAMGALLGRLGARIHRCERRDSDPAGDPAMLRFREAVEAGSVPFTVQGPENTLCLDSGRTIAWEAVAQIEAESGGSFDAVFIQVGGGAFVSCVGSVMAEQAEPPTVYAVQAEGCAPLARAWDRAAGRPDPEGHWADLMTPWVDPRSLADGILDDETYDWLGAFESMRAGGGSPLVAPEAEIVRAHEMFVAAGYAVSPTGSAGLAGLLAAREGMDENRNVLVVASGVAR
jgi:threonine dehydratase